MQWSCSIHWFLKNGTLVILICVAAEKSLKGQSREISTASTLCPRRDNISSRIASIGLSITEKGLSYQDRLEHALPTASSSRSIRKRRRRRRCWRESHHLFFVKTVSTPNGLSLLWPGTEVFLKAARRRPFASLSPNFVSPQREWTLRRNQYNSS